MSQSDASAPTNVRDDVTADVRVLATPPRRRPRLVIPWGFVGMLVLMLGVETRLSRISTDFDDFIVRDWKQSRKESSRDLGQCQLLCFGDSQVKTGVVPQVLEARTGWRAYNLALAGGQAPSSYFLLRRALAGGARPAAVVVDFLPPLLRLDIVRMDRHFPELLDLSEAAELAWTDRNPGRFLTYATAILLPSVRSRLSLRTGVSLALQGKNPSRRGDTYFRRNWRLNRGAMLFAPRPLEEDPESWYGINYPAPWASNRLNAIYVDRFLDLANKHGIAVYWLLHPIAPTAQQLCERRGQDDRFDRFVEEALNRHPNLSVVDGRHSGYRDTEFTDTVHLHAKAAAELSEGLAEVLRYRVDAPASAIRRLVLPTYQQRPRSFPVENLSESALALKRLETISRIR